MTDADNPTGVQTKEVVLYDDDGAVIEAANPLPVSQASPSDGTYIGDVKFGEALPAGSEIVGGVRDSGPSQAVTRTYTASADMTTAADISPAPASGEKIVAMDILVSTDTAMNFSIQDETSGTVRAKVFLPANGTVPITLRGYIKAGVADKKLQGKASVSGNIAITCITFSEA